MPLDVSVVQDEQGPSDAQLEAFYTEIGQRVRAARIQTGLKQDDLARELHLARSSVANLEAGRQRVPVHTLLLAAQALQIRLEELLPDLDVEPSLRTELGLGPDVPQDHLKLVKNVVSGRSEGAF